MIVKDLGAVVEGGEDPQQAGRSSTYHAIET